MTAPTETTSIKRPNDARAASLAKKVRKIIAKHGFCSLATVSPDGAPHVVGVNYKYVNGHLYFITYESSKKARNIRSNPKVAIHIAVRQYPLHDLFGPPFSVQFSGTATILSPEDPEIVELLESGKLKSITGHGVLKQPGGCFLKVQPARKIHTYGIGIPALTLIRDVSHGDRTVAVD